MARSICGEYDVVILDDQHAQVNAAEVWRGVFIREPGGRIPFNPDNSLELKLRHTGEGRCPAEKNTPRSGTNGRFCLLCRLISMLDSGLRRNDGLMDYLGLTGAPNIIYLYYIDNRLYHTNMKSNLTWDEPKRQAALNDRGIDFSDAAVVFAGLVFEFEDTRRDYGECRMVCFGFMAGRMMVVGYVQRGEKRHIFSMRKANEREIECYGKRLGQD